MTEQESTTDDVQPTVVVRRTRGTDRLRPRVVPSESTVIVGRNVLGSRASGKPQTSRERQIAGDLPDWEPLPPGELIVQRPMP